MNNNLKLERKELIKNLFSSLDFTLKLYTPSYNSEIVLFNCNKCGKEYNQKFIFSLAKMNNQNLCSCHKNEKPIENELYDFQNHFEDYKFRNQEDEKTLKDKEEFLLREKNLILSLIMKNRKATYNIKEDGDYIIKCHDNHVFSLSYKDIINGKKWCKCKLAINK